MIRILFLSANPIDYEPPLRLYREFESIDDTLQLTKIVFGIQQDTRIIIRI
jgi:hypothetical protein